MNNLLDLYTDYLISQNKYATSTGFSDLVNGSISHDKMTRFLNGKLLGSKELWGYIKPEVRSVEKEGGALILDDSIQEKPYTDENEIMCWHYSHAKGMHVKGANLLSCIVQYDDVSMPIGYEIIHKDVSYSEIKTKKVKRKAFITKNEHFRNLLSQAHSNKVLFEWVLADNWFGSKENLEYINNIIKKKFIIGIKSNRTVALSEKEKLKGDFTKVSKLDLEDGQSIKVWVKGIDFALQLIKKVFTNEDSSKGVLYIISNDLKHGADYLYMIYQKRWKIELYHKSIKQNASLAASPTKRVLSQANHIFSSLVAFCKLELLKIKTAANHFAIKHLLLLKANQAAFLELQNLKNSSSA